MNHGISPKKLKQSTLDELFGIKSSGKKSQTQKAETEYSTHKSAAGTENLNRMKCGSQDEDKRRQVENPILCHSPMKSSQSSATSCSKDRPENTNCIDGSQDTCSEFDEDFSPAPALVTMSSQGDSSIHTQASIMTTDEENNIELQPSCFPLEKMNRAPACWTKEEEFITPDKDHSVMFTLPYDYDSEGDVQPKPSPANYTDCWGDHHVKMPCSIHNDYAVEGKLKQRWELIQLALMLKIKSSHDLEAAILKYNLRYKGVWKFHALHQLFEKMEESKREEFFEKQLPSMIKLALRLPYICTLPIPLLKKNTNRSITFSQEQVACLLANAFFCTFPRRNTFKRNSEYFNYPSINFTSLYQNVTPHTLEKLKCILHYFRRVTTKMPNGTVTFQRQCLKDFPDWVTSQRTLSRLYCSSKGTIEDTGPGFLEVDFANKRIGGGVLRGGCVQEEIRFVICPELLLARLFTEVLEDNECLIIKGFERFSNYSGYSSSFLWKGDYQDKSVRNSWGRRVSQLTCIDALIVSSYTNQFKQWHVVRELNKAYCGFYDKSEKKEANLPAVCTGNWGCGAFGGNHQLKALIQLMAASEAHRDVCYFTFKDKKLEKDLCDIHKFLTSRSISICQLMNLIEQYRQDILNQKPLCSDDINLFDYIYQQCSAD